MGIKVNQYDNIEKKIKSLRDWIDGCKNGIIGVSGNHPNII